MPKHFPSLQQLRSSINFGCYDSTFVMIGFKTFFFFQRNKINKNNGRNHITKHLFFVEELLCFLGLWAGLDDRDKEGEAE